MPKGSKVDNCYQAMKHEGKGKAAAICQDSTGQSLKTGKKPMRGQRAKTNKSKGK